MPADASEYDLAIIGGGAGGLTAADFAAQLGTRVALIEKDRIGGDCTWSGCVPSKSLLKVAKVAQSVRGAGRFGIQASTPTADMEAVRGYLRHTIQQIYQSTTPEALQAKGIDVLLGPGRFIDPHTICVGDAHVRAKKILLTTGAKPRLPTIDGLESVPFVTYKEIFEIDRLPGPMVIVGGGPLSTEIAQAYRRLGAEVTIIAHGLLPRDEPEARQVIEDVLQMEGVKILRGRAKSVRCERERIIVTTGKNETSGDLLFVATGRAPVVNGLSLEKAGVSYSEKGIPVDDHLRTNVSHIYAAGDVVGGYQFSHLAAWQSFHAVRNALIPGYSKGLTNKVPWVTFTDPEVAHIGLTEEQARKKFGEDVIVGKTEMSHVDRAVSEDDQNGFIKVVAKKNGTVIGATVVCERAGETITELIVAIEREMGVSDLAHPIHAYPTYSGAVEQLAAKMATHRTLSGVSGGAIRWLSKLTR